MSADAKPVHTQCVGIGQVRIHLLMNLLVISEHNVQLSIWNFKVNWRHRGSILRRVWDMSFTILSQFGMTIHGLWSGYWHNSELQEVTVPSPVYTFYKSPPQANSPRPSLCISWQRILTQYLQQSRCTYNTHKLSSLLHSLTFATNSFLHSWTFNSQLTGSPPSCLSYNLFVRTEQITPPTIIVLL
jgi:hypothetical protein